MRSMSSLDIAVVIRELESVIGSRVDKVYHYPPDEIRIKLRGKGRWDLIIEAGKRFHPTIFPKESPRFPSPFAMLLRKHLEGAKLVSLKQYDFDRVILLEFEREERKYLIAELFSKGNIILTDENFKVIMPLRGKSGGIYTFPEKRVTPLDISVEDLRNLLDEREIVRIIATKLGTGGLYAEEILERAEVDKRKKGSEISDEELGRILEAIREIYRLEDLRPHIVIKDGRYYDYQPIELIKYRDFEKKYFERYYEAIDSFFAFKESERAEEAEKKSEVIEALEARLKKQIEKKEEFERDYELNKRIAEAIYENYTKLEEIRLAFLKARERRSWEEIKRIVLEQKKKGSLREIKEIIPKENAVVVEIGGLEIRLWIDKSLPEIAEEYYNRAKRIKQKLDGLLKAIEKTKEEIRNAEEVETRKILKSIRIVRRREWFEKYRWYITSEGFLVIGGRNAEMNEEIVSKHLESRDLFFHTSAPGGAATVLKMGQEAGERSVKEAAEFAAIYSSLWKEGKYSGEVYYVFPEQVKRAAKHGEYLKKGSFFIEGKRNYLNVSLKAAIGVDLKNLRLMGGPVEGVKRHCDYYVEIEIGDKDFNEFSVEVAKRLIEMAKDEEKHIVRSIATPDEVAKFLPPGRSRIS